MKRNLLRLFGFYSKEATFMRGAQVRAQPALGTSCPKGRHLQLAVAREAV